MLRFYVNLLLETPDTIELPLDVVRHINVLRIKQNEEITLFNGNGHEYLANFLSLSKKSAIVKIFKKQEKFNNLEIEIQLAMCIIANDKMDLIIQKATELGVSEIIPIISGRTQKVNLDKRIEHWQKIVINSCEQCGRNILTKIQKPIPLKQLFLDYKNTDLKFILSPYNNNSNSEKIKFTERMVLLLVGPEGGFIDSEIIDATKYGYKTIKLGNYILRAETAAIAGITLMHTVLGNFKNSIIM